MTTTLIPIDPAISPQWSTRILTISANLLPEEIVAARLARRTRAWVIVAVLVVAGLCAAWFAYALLEKQAADRELAAASTTVTDLQRDQREFSETVQVQTDTATLTKQLTTVMANDLDWAAMLAALRSAGVPSRIGLTSVNTALNETEAATSANPLPRTGAVGSIGSITLTGGAPDKKAVAAYAEALAKQSLVTNPYITNVTKDTNGNGVTFSLKADIPQTALCGRFTVKCTSSGGN
jgi:Tfp pilus assembly protein PilN